MLFTSKNIGEGNGNPLQYSCLENPMDGGAWWATVHGSQRVGHNFTFTFTFTSTIFRSSLWNPQRFFF